MPAPADVGYHALRHARWRWSEIAFWILVLACGFLFPSRYLIMTEILRLALFALSLDLILGYAGIVSLGHAAFFGVGAYGAGLLALHGIVNEPVVALVVTGLAAAVVGFLTSFLVIRGVDLTRLMVTLGIALLLEALAACAGVTMAAVATSIGVELRGGTVRAEGDLDFRGTLAVAKDAPVGFQQIRLEFQLDTDASEEQLANLLASRLLAANW